MYSQRKVAGLLSFCALSIALAIALDAFGAHGLKKILSPERILVFEKANHYLLFQNLALLLLLNLNNTKNLSYLPTAINILLAGVWIFCISLYLASFKELPGCSSFSKFGIVAPVGGTLMILAWVLIFLSFLKHKKNSQ